MTLPGAFLIRSAALILVLPLALHAQATAKPPTTPPDLLVFVNGEQLSGEFESATADGIVFKSPMAGEIKVAWKNIKQLRSSKPFAVLAKNQKLTRKNALSAVPHGQVEVAGNQITVGPRTEPVANANLLIDGAAFDKAVNRHPSLLHDFGGTATTGVSLVRATQNTTTFSGAIALVRTEPQVDWLPPRDRTNLNYSQSYGTTTEPGTIPVETNIFHANLERDEYFSPRLFAFASGNFAQNLGLQAAYGPGIGMTIVKSPAQEFDVKADVHYLEETFFTSVANPTLPGPNVNVVSSTFSETYLRKLPKGLVFNENGSVSPAWTNEADFSAHVNGSLGFPLFKGLGFNITASDDFLDNAPAGTTQNSSQFSTGLSYAIKPR